MFDGGRLGLLTDKRLFCGCLGKVWFEIKFSYFATSGTAIICDHRVARKTSGDEVEYSARCTQSFCSSSSSCQATIDIPVERENVQR